MNTTATPTDLATAARVMAVLLTARPDLPPPFNAEVSRHSGTALQFHDAEGFTAWCDHLGFTPENVSPGIHGEAHHRARGTYEGQPLRLTWVEFR